MFYIKRCVQIGINAIGSSRPNPMVGCVIVYNNKIIGEGYTSNYGGNHAEVNAINSVKDKTLLKSSTLYVTLEPCSHFGKTPPCSNVIIKHKIPRVVIGCKDINKKVAGKGIEALKQAGIKVNVDVLEHECRAHHKRFFTFHKKRRPYIILKWAKSQDGYIAPKKDKKSLSYWITNARSKQLVHKWRAQEQAILIGSQTARLDNPKLTTRHWFGQHPIRLVINHTNTLSKSLHVFNDNAQTLILNSKQINYSNNVAKQVCNIMFEENINSVIVEGGTQTLQTFIDENLWDEARVFNRKN